MSSGNSGAVLKANRRKGPELLQPLFKRQVLLFLCLELSIEVILALEYQRLIVCLFFWRALFSLVSFCTSMVATSASYLLSSWYELFECVPCSSSWSLSIAIFSSLVLKRETHGWKPRDPETVLGKQHLFVSLLGAQC